MLAFIPSSLADLSDLILSPYFWLPVAFQIWMLVDAFRRREWVWFFIILVFSVFAALWYFFMVYRNAPSATRGFELPGAHDRRRIKELQAQIHHLDKPHHHLQLGDIYFQRGRLALAEASYRAAQARDPQDLDIRSHLGQCLLRQNKLAEARPLLEGVCLQDAKHEYGYSLMALAETLTALGETDAAIGVWRCLLENHAYARARVQLAELCAARQQWDLARIEIQEVLADDALAPAFQRRRDRVWLGRAKKLARKLKG
ncbi:MAG: tetratricopeptide repeat protein [Pedosphaera sp.]|nr:tetratricopeptide repeat protein [Pedosphaera sp.]